MSTDPLHDGIEGLQLVDHHVHGSLRHEVDRPALEAVLTESNRQIPTWMTQFDSQVGFAIRRWCAPLLDLEPGASADDYVRRRAELGETEVARRLLRASGVEHYLLDTGFAPAQVLEPTQMAAASQASVHEVVRLESVLESVVTAGADAESTVEEFPALLAEATAHAVGVKSIVAYRYGFDFDPHRPARADVVNAIRAWSDTIDAGAAPRVQDPVLLRYLLWTAVDRGLPIQLHVGYGDPDLDLRRCDPLLLTPFLRSIEQQQVPVLLLHCYPYHRNAGYLAQAFPHVFFDVGLAVNYTGARSAAVIAESLELAPFAKVLFSSDAWGPAELHYLGARLWRRGTEHVLRRWVDDGDWTRDDALRVATMVGRDNALRLYRLVDGA